jgi:8-oxo-dGTP diphosphatase
MRKKLVHVDVSVIVMKEDKLLLGERKKSRENRKGYRIWELPVGALEVGESFSDCGHRETKEETGLDVDIADEEPFTYLNVKYPRKKAQEVVFYYRANYTNGEPKISGREKKIFSRWEWFSRDELPSKLSTSLRNLINEGYELFKK